MDTGLRDPKKQLDGFFKAYLFFINGSLELFDVDLDDSKTRRLSSLYYNAAWDYLLECFYLPIDMKYSTDKIKSFKDSGLDAEVIAEIFANGTTGLTHEENEYLEAGPDDAKAFLFGGEPAANMRLHSYFHFNYYEKKGTLK